MHRHRFVSFFSLVLLVGHLLCGQQFFDEKKSSEIDAYVKREMEKRQIPGLALGISYKGKIIKEEGYGLADIQHQVPVKTNTVFELASITKQFTAVAIMLLVQEGKIDLDGEVHNYLPDAPENWRGVTVRHLLTHTSGLPFLGEGFTGFKTMEREKLLEMFGVNFTAEIAYEAAKADTLSFTPCDKHVYSDVGFFLIGLIIQKVCGMPYREFMQQRIFDPVGMDETYILDQVKIHPNEARGYTLKDGELVNIRRIWAYEVPSHYGIFSSVGNLTKWDAVLNTEKILTNESKEEMFQPMVRNNGLPYPYGFGWSVWNRNSKKIIDHTGITGTQITRFIKDSLSVVVLTNLGRRWGGSINSWGLGPEIANMLGFSPYIDKDYSTLSGAKVVNGKKSKLKKLEGIYAMTDGGSERRLYLADNKLIYDRGVSESEMVPLDDGRY